MHQLRSELKNVKKGTQSISEYLLKIKAIVDALVAIGDPISDQDHIDAVLEGLPEEYSPFVMMIYSRIDPPSIHDIESLLMVQEVQLEKFKHDLSSGSVSANVAYTPNSNNNPRFNNFRGRGG